MTLRLVLAADHAVVLEGLRALLALESDLDVCAVCTDGQEAVEAVRAEKPDVLVMDIAMPNCGGLEAYERLRADGQRVPTVVLSATLDDPTILRCVRAAVDGLVLKESAASELIEAIRAVARGERWIPSEIAGRALDLMSKNRPAGESDLTPREQEVVTLVAGGSANKRVAAELGIAESTVKLHLHSAFTKLDVSNRVQLSLLARERGWI